MEKISILPNHYKELGEFLLKDLKTIPAYKNKELTIVRFRITPWGLFVSYKTNSSPQVYARSYSWLQLHKITEV